jgi:hypothetical protein
MGYCNNLLHQSHNSHINRENLGDRLNTNFTNSEGSSIVSIPTVSLLLVIPVNNLNKNLQFLVNRLIVKYFYLLSE